MTPLQTLPYKIFNQQLAIRTTTASISCFMSFLLLVMILWNQDGLKSPYSRIIFFISIGDIFASFGIIIGPHAIPKEYSDLGAYWAKGTTATCNISGIVTAMGALYLVPFYTLLLSYYFLKRVKDKIKPTEFTTTYEKKIHVLIWVFAIGACIYALVKNFMNPNEEGQLCMIFDTRDEFECMLRDDPDEDCTRGKIYRGLMILAMGPICLTLLLLIFNLVRFILFVYKQERLMHLEALDERERKAKIAEKQARSASFISDDTPQERIPPDTAITNEPATNNENQQEANDSPEKNSCCWIKCGNKDTEKKQPLTRKALIQSSMYIVTFVVAYSLPIIVFLKLDFGGGNVPIWLRWLQSTFFPLNGLFTMLIYTRPKVQQVRRNFPEIADLSYIVLLLIVIFSGGETPKEIDLGSSYYREEESKNEQNFIDDNNHHINTQDQQAIDDLFAKYQVSSVGDDDSIFAKIGKVSKVIRLSSKADSSRGRSENVSAGDNGISYDEGVNSFNSSVMDT